MPTALITGISGQDGTYLTELLLDAGYTVHGTVSTPTHSEHMPQAHEVTLHTVDLRQRGGLSDIINTVQPHEIYNLAALSSVYQSWMHPLDTAMINGLAVAELLNAAWSLQESTNTPITVVQASSAELFGSPDADNTPQIETTPIRPTSPYGAGKAYAHHLIGVYRGRGLRAASAILYNHESPLRPETFVTRKITAGAARIAAGQQEVIELGTLDVHRDWGWAPDYAHALQLIAGAATTDAPNDFIISTGQLHSITDFLRIAFQRVGITDWQPYVRVSQQFARPVDPSEQVGDSSQARTVLGWKPTKTFEDIVHTMVDFDVSRLSAGPHTSADPHISAGPHVSQNP